MPPSRRPSSTAVPTVGCPANGNSAAGVKMRSLARCAEFSGGSTNTVSGRLNSRAIACMASLLKPSGSSTTASGLPAKRVSVKTSRCGNGAARCEPPRAVGANAAAYTSGGNCRPGVRGLASDASMKNSAPQFRLRDGYGSTRPTAASIGRSAAMATTWLLTGSPFMPRTDSVTLPSRQSMSTVPKLAAP